MKRSLICIITLLFLYGCFGAGVQSPIECPESTDLFLAWRLLSINPITSPDEKFKDDIGMPTKQDFLQVKGKPDEILVIDEITETWVYETVEWCGIWVGWGLLAPLTLPACDGADAITFENNTVKHVKITRSKFSGLVLLYPSEAVGPHDYCNALIGE